MTGKFLLRKDRKPNKFGEYPIILQYSTQGVPVRTTTGLSVHPDFWLEDDGRCTKFIKGGKTGHPKSDMMNRRLLQQKREIDIIIDKLMVDKNSVMTVPMLRSILNGTYKEEMEGGQGRVSFVEHVLDYNRQLYELQKISYSVWKNIHCNMGNFRKFLQEVKHKDIDKTNILYCRDVTVELIKEYILWRKHRGNTNDTINKSLTPIFKTLRQITRRGWITRDVCEDICEMYLPTQCQSLEEPKDGDVNYLTIKQVKQLIKLTGESRYPRTKELMDMFLFSIHCGGMRFSDVCTLRWSEVNLETRKIRHLQVKNHTRKGKWVENYINDECMELLLKWKGRFDNFVFGLLPDEFDLSDEQMLNQTINSRNRTMNQSLQCMGEKMGLPFRLHFHCGRHTYAVIALNNGVDIKKISDRMGHSTSFVTEKVYAKFLPETLKQEVDDKLNFRFKDIEEDEIEDGKE